MEYITWLFKENPIINFIFQLDSWFLGNVLKTTQNSAQIPIPSDSLVVEEKVQFWRWKVQKSANFCTPYNLHTRKNTTHIVKKAVIVYISDTAYSWESKEPWGDLKFPSPATQ